MQVHTVLAFSLASLIVAGVSAQTPSSSDVKVAEMKWTCSVTTEGAQLVWSRYTGGGWADIHIVPFGRPGSYKVIKENDTTVTGETHNGTKFVCKLA